MAKIAATAHASQRMQQRAISAIQVRLVEPFGITEYQKGGCNFGYIPEKTLIELRRAIDKLAGVAVVFGDEGKIVTAMHQNKRVHKTEYAA